MLLFRANRLIFSKFLVTKQFFLPLFSLPPFFSLGRSLCSPELDFPKKKAYTTKLTMRKVLRGYGLPLESCSVKLGNFHT